MIQSTLLSSHLPLNPLRSEPDGWKTLILTDLDSVSGLERRKLDISTSSQVSATCSTCSSAGSSNSDDRWDELFFRRTTRARSILRFVNVSDMCMNGAELSWIASSTSRKKIVQMQHHIEADNLQSRFQSTGSHW